MFRKELKITPHLFSGYHLFCTTFKYSTVSLGTVRQSFCSKTSAEVGSGGGMHLEMIARWWHGKRPSFDSPYMSIRNIPCSICMWRIRHIHSSHRTTISWNTSAEYLLPNPEGVCDSYIVPINEKNVTIQKLSFFRFLIKSFKQLITSFYRLESQMEFWTYYFTKTPGVNLSPKNHFTWTIWLSYGVSEHTLDGNLK